VLCSAICSRRDGRRSNAVLKIRVCFERQQSPSSGPPTAPSRPSVACSTVYATAYCTRIPARSVHVASGYAAHVCWGDAAGTTLTRARWHGDPGMACGEQPGRGRRRACPSSTQSVDACHPPSAHSLALLLKYATGGTCQSLLGRYASRNARHHFSARASSHYTRDIIVLCCASTCWFARYAWCGVHVTLSRVIAAFLSYPDAVERRRMPRWCRLFARYRRLLRCWRMAW